MRKARKKPQPAASGIDMSKVIFEDDAEIFVRDLVDEFESASATPIIVTIPGRGALAFGRLVSRSKFNQLKAKSREFITKSTPEACPVEENKIYFDQDDETKGWSYMLATLSQRPKFTPFHFLKIAKGNVWLFEQIKDDYMLQLVLGFSQADAAGIDKAKNASSGTPSGEAS